jgi:hypothetical protein
MLGFRGLEGKVGRPEEREYAICAADPGRLGIQPLVHFGMLEPSSSGFAEQDINRNYYLVKYI